MLLQFSSRQPRAIGPATPVAGPRMAAAPAQGSSPCHQGEGEGSGAPPGDAAGSGPWTGSGGAPPGDAGPPAAHPQQRQVQLVRGAEVTTYVMMLVVQGVMWQHSAAAAAPQAHDCLRLAVFAAGLAALCLPQAAWLRYRCAECVLALVPVPAWVRDGLAPEGGWAGRAVVLQPCPRGLPSPGPCCDGCWTSMRCHSTTRLLGRSAWLPRRVWIIGASRLAAACVTTHQPTGVGACPHKLPAITCMHLSAGVPWQALPASVRPLWLPHPRFDDGHAACSGACLAAPPGLRVQEGVSKLLHQSATAGAAGGVVDWLRIAAGGSPRAGPADVPVQLRCS